MSDLVIASLEATPPVVAELAAMLVETVADGGSVSFMHPLSTEAAEAFWTDSLARAARAERAVLGAWRQGDLVGTVTLQLAFPPNQPHRAEIAKLITRLAARQQGVGTALMRAAEQLAIDRGRTHLLLDTAQDGGASLLYERLGFRQAGLIPDYALKPHGGLSATMLYWKPLALRDKASEDDP